MIEDWGRIMCARLESLVDAGVRGSSKAWPY